MYPQYKFQPKRRPSNFFNFKHYDPEAKIKPVDTIPPVNNTLDHHGPDTFQNDFENEDFYDQEEKELSGSEFPEFHEGSPFSPL